MCIYDIYIYIYSLNYTQNIINKDRIYKVQIGMTTNLTTESFTSFYVCFFFFTQIIII